MLSSTLTTAAASWLMTGLLPAALMALSRMLRASAFYGD
jgi:hypothetical protein